MKQKIFIIFILNITLSVSNVVIAQYQNRIDSLEQVLIPLKQDTNRVKILLELGRIYKNVKPDSALYYLNNAINLSKKISSKNYTAECLNTVGIAYAKLGRYKKAILSWEEAIVMYKEIDNLHGEAGALGNLGVVYRNQGNYDKALEYYQKALKINESIGNKQYIAINLGNIGIVYRNQKNYDKAIEYYQKALKMSKDLNDERSIARNIGNIGIIYNKKGNYDKSLEYYLRALKIYKDLGDKSGIAVNLGNIGIAYSGLKDYNKAIDYYQQSLKINKEVGDKDGIINNYLNISNLNNKLKQYNIAISYADKALEMAKEIGALRLQKFSYLYLSDAYKGLKNYPKVLEYKDLLIQVNDSMFSTEKTKAIADMQTRYESEKKEQQIKLQEAEIEKGKQQVAKEIAEKEKKQTQRNMFIVAFVLMLVLALFIFKSYREKKKANKLLAKQKEEILEKNEELNQQNEEITAQRDEIEEQKELVEEINSHISESIDYATRLQSSILPDEKILTKNVSDHFILFKPKDKVSGDFYWWANVEGQTIITAADSTGHGVPGAFMSMLGGSFLREIVQKEYITHTGVILRKLRKEVIKALKQTGAENEQKDGMDMAIISINHETNIVQFSGANNPLYIVKSGKLKVESEESTAIKLYELDELSTFKLYEVKPNKMPIAIYAKMDNFTTHEIQLEKGDQLYMFSDGFADQFGGKKGKKFMYKPFKKLILENADKPMTEQKEILNQAFENWKGDLEQIDDVVVVGVKV